jgi:hypothetical protein
MREALLRHVRAGGAGLAGPVLEAARLLAADTTTEPRAYAGPPRARAS